MRVMRGGLATGLGMLLCTGCYSGLGVDAMAGDPDGDGSGVDSGPSGSGDDGDDGGSDSDDTGEGELGAGPTPMRRLTSAQYVTSVRDLLEIPEWIPAGDLPNDGFNEEEFQLSNMLAAGVSTTTVDYGRYRDLGKSAAETALAPTRQ